jgi:hypothetical protein
MEAEILLPFSEDPVLFHKSPYTELEESSSQSSVIFLNIIFNIVVYLLTRHGIWICNSIY